MARSLRFYSPYLILLIEGGERSMKKLKELGDLNSWVLPWVGVVFMISSLIFPDALLKTGEIITDIFLFLIKHWMYSLIACWVVYSHLEIRKIKYGKRISVKKQK